MLETPQESNTVPETCVTECSLDPHQGRHRDERPSLKWLTSPNAVPLKSDSNVREIIHKENGPHSGEISELSIAKRKFPNTNQSIYTKKRALQSPSSSGEASRKSRSYDCDGIPHRDMPHKSETCDIAVAQVRHQNVNQAVSDYTEPTETRPKTDLFELKLPIQLKLPLNVSSIVYKGKVYKCNTCAMTFTDEQRLRAHQAADHTG